MKKKKQEPKEPKEPTELEVRLYKSNGLERELVAALFYDLKEQDDPEDIIILQGSAGKVTVFTLSRFSYLEGWKEYEEAPVTTVVEIKRTTFAEIIAKAKGQNP